MLIIPKRTGHAILMAFFLAIFLAGAIEVAAEEKAVTQARRWPATFPGLRRKFRAPSR